MNSKNNEMYKVRFIGDGEWGFKHGEIYDAFELRCVQPMGTDLIGVVDKYNEEYAFPRKYFEKI